MKLVQEKGKKQKKYRLWTPEERAEIGKYAFDHSNKSTLLHMHQKYPELTHQTITEFKKAYKTEKERKGNIAVGIYCFRRYKISF